MNLNGARNGIAKTADRIRRSCQSSSFFVSSLAHTYTRIVRDTRYSGTLGCANLKVSQVPEVARAAEKRAAPFRRGHEEKEDGRRGPGGEGEEEHAAVVLH